MCEANAANSMKRKNRDPEAVAADVDDDQLAKLIRSARPSVAIFDLDSTLWDGNVENYVAAHVVGDGEAVNTDGTQRPSLRLFKDVKAICTLFAEHRVPLAIASASPARTTAVRLLKSFGIHTSDQQVYPGSKDKHLKAIASTLSTPLARAIFFDDLPFNIKAAEACGIGAAVLVRGGLSKVDVKEALRKLRDRSAGAALMRSWMGAAAGTNKVAKQDHPSTEAPSAAQHDEK